MFKSENGTKIHIPGANLNEIANQADDLLEVITKIAPAWYHLLDSC